MKICCLLLSILISAVSIAALLRKKAVVHKDLLFEMQRILEAQGYTKYLCCDTNIKIRRKDITHRRLKKNMKFFKFDKIIIYGKQKMVGYALYDSCITFSNYSGIGNYHDITIDLAKRKRDIKEYVEAMYLEDNLFYREGCLAF